MKIIALMENTAARPELACEHGLSLYSKRWDTGFSLTPVRAKPLRAMPPGSAWI